jgi:putative ABC transport system permease protein
MLTAIRSLASDRGFTVVAVLTIALGIGANTAIFSTVYGVLLRPLPYPGADRIVQVWSTGREEPRSNHAAPDFIEYQRRAQTLEKLSGYREDALTLVPAGGDPVTVSGAHVTVDYFDVFGTGAVVGRAFSRSTDEGAQQPMAVISYRTWRDTLGSDPSVVGRLLRINSVPHTVVGVMPETFDYPLGARAWILSTKPVPPPPVDVQGDLLEERNIQYFLAVGRLTDTSSIEQAQSELAAIAAGMQRQHPQSNASRGVLVERLRDSIVGDVRLALFVLLAAVAVVLLIACANVASLLLARASRKQRELAIRRALGASRERLVGQLLLESLLLAVVGGAIGIVAGAWSIDLLVALIPGDLVPRLDEVRVDARVAGVAVLISLVSAALFGLVPSLQASKAGASSLLKDAGDRASTAGRARRQTRSALVVIEIALTLVLLVSAGLLANSFLRLQRVDPGFDTGQVALMQMPLPQGKYKDGKAQAAFYKQLLDGLKMRGEVRSAAVVFPGPLEAHNAHGSFSVESRPAATPADRPSAFIASVSPDYLRTMGITLISGRALTDQDGDAKATPIIVNATFVRRIWPGEDPLGKRIRFDDATDEWLTVVGVCADSRNDGLDAEPQPVMYIPYQAFTLPFMNLVVRSERGSDAIGSAVRAEVRRLDPELPIDRVRPLDQIVNESVAEPRFRTLLLGAFAITALILAAIGVYGLISYSVAQRTREIGIRVALGARPAQILGPIIREGMTLAIIGVTLGLIGSLTATRVIAAFLFGIDATDPLTFSAISLLLLGVALVASYIPSRRALRVDPLIALRAE